MTLKVYIVVIEMESESNKRGYCGCTNKIIHSIYFSETKAHQESKKVRDSHVENSIIDSTEIDWLMDR